MLDEIVQQITEVEPPIKIMLFGSRARGVNRPDSDLDILVIEELETHRQGRPPEYRLALKDIPLPIDVVVKTPYEVYEWSKVSSAFITTAIAEGKVIYRKPTKNYHDLAETWFQKADKDIKVAQVLINAGEIESYEAVCFHAQQAVEKYLKGFIKLKGDATPRIYDLVALNDKCIEHGASWEIAEDALSNLSEYAVDTRYQLDFSPNRQIAADALNNAKTICEAVLTVQQELKRQMGADSTDADKNS